MIQINVLASSSKGNSILVDDGYSKILLDAGLPYSKLARQVKISKVEAVLITHEHADHSKAVPELLRRGVDVHMSSGTAEAIQSPPFLPARHLVQIETEHWKILPFDVVHDVAEPLGYLFESRETGEKGVYIVDSAFVNYSFRGITHWVLECNHDEDLLEQGDYKPWLKDRVRRSHFSLQNLKDFLSTSDLSATKEIHLVHLSDSNSDELAFEQEIQKLTGCPVYIGGVGVG